MMYLGFIPLKLSTSWDHVNINLAKVTNELFGAKYVETVKIKVSFCRLQLPVHVHTHSPYRLISTLSFRFIQTVEYGGCISPTGSTLTKSCRVFTRRKFHRKAKQHPVKLQQRPISRPRGPLGHVIKTTRRKQMRTWALPSKQLLLVKTTCVVFSLS